MANGNGCEVITASRQQQIPSASCSEEEEEEEEEKSKAETYQKINQNSPAVLNKPIFAL